MLLIVCHEPSGTYAFLLHQWSFVVKLQSHGTTVVPGVDDTCEQLYHFSHYVCRDFVGRQGDGVALVVMFNVATLVFACF